MSEETEGVAEVEETLEAVAVAVEEAPEAEAAQEVVEAEETAEAPEAVVEEIAAVVEEVPAVEEAAPHATARREATLYLCERGHRTLIMWGEAPATCNARKTRNEVCGMTLYHSTELPEQVQKALNPIKASKKKSGKK